MQPTPQLTELERIEITRRIDVARSTLPAATQYFTEKDAVDERIKSASKPSRHFFPFSAFFVSLLIHEYMLGGGWHFTWASIITVAAIIWSVEDQYQLVRLKNRYVNLYKWLQDLEVIWIGATGNNSFWELSQFVKDGYLDDDSDEFLLWRVRQHADIINTVCGLEKGIPIGREWVREMEEHIVNRREPLPVEQLGD